MKRKRPYWLMLDNTSKGIPLWMYYIRSLLEIGGGVVNLFTLVFRKQTGFSLDWSGYMLRKAYKTYKANWLIKK